MTLLMLVNARTPVALQFSSASLIVGCSDGSHKLFASRAKLLRGFCACCVHARRRTDLSDVDECQAVPCCRLPSGKDLFLEHCAQCHGGGTGNGSMASVLNVTPADLTTLDKRANGKFDAARGADISGHGTRAMPIWGLGLQHEVHGGQGGAAYSGRAVIEFKTYLQSVQKK